jgi:hypothetical protein
LALALHCHNAAGPVFYRCKLQGRDVATRVGAITKWLAFGFATLAPEIIFAYFQVDFGWGDRCNNWNRICHVSNLDLPDHVGRY